MNSPTRQHLSVIDHLPKKLPPDYLVVTSHHELHQNLKAAWCAGQFGTQTAEGYASSLLKAWQPPEVPISNEREPFIFPEAGPWKVVDWQRRRVAIQSSDFTHDVALEITGDFGTSSLLHMHATEIAARLTEWKSLQAEIARLTAENDRLCQAVVDAQQNAPWQHLRKVNLPHPNELGARVLGFVVPDDGKPVEKVSERLSELIGAGTLNGAVPQMQGPAVNGEGTVSRIGAEEPSAATPPKRRPSK